MRPLVLLLLAACGDPTPEAPGPEPVAEPEPAEPAPEPALDPEAEALARAKTGAKALGSTLMARVVEGLASGTPESTLVMCSEEAQGLTALVASEHGVKVGRTSDRLRNPTNAGPEWAATWLASVKDTPPGEIAPMTAVVEVEGGKAARFAAPIVIAEPCLACHGEPSAAVKAELAKRYPEDRATGYALGELRGALWAEASVR